MFSHTAELHFNHYYIFIEDLRKPSCGLTRDSEGVLHIKLYRVQLSIYGRTFNRKWRGH